jgi:Fic family protein
MNREVDRVYRGNLDPSGKIFKEYSKLFTNLATLDARRLTGLTAKQNLLHPNRPFRAEAIKEIVEKLGRDMTFNTNAIEGNPLTAKETTLILSGFSAGRGKLRDIYDIVGHKKAFDEALELSRKKTDERTVEFCDWAWKLRRFLERKTICATMGGGKPFDGIS